MVSHQYVFHVNLDLKEIIDDQPNNRNSRHKIIHDQYITIENSYFLYFCYPISLGGYTHPRTILTWIFLGPGSFINASIVVKPENEVPAAKIDFKEPE